MIVQLFEISVDLLFLVGWLHSIVPLSGCVLGGMNDQSLGS